VAELMLRPVAESDLRTLERWFRDHEVRKRLGGMVPLRGWLHHVSTHEGRLAWMAVEKGSAVGLVDLETYADGTASFAFVVAPRLRFRGYGKRLVRALRSRPEVADLTSLEGLVEPDNTAALRCLRAVGFAARSLEADEEGFLTLVYPPPDPP
jgi:RimJ/RimL family protein N-acetyltransferase